MKLGILKYRFPDQDVLEYNGLFFPIQDKQNYNGFCIAVGRHIPSESFNHGCKAAWDVMVATPSGTWSPGAVRCEERITQRTGGNGRPLCARRANGMERINGECLIGINIMSNTA